MSDGDSKTLIIAPAEKIRPLKAPAKGVTAISWEEFNAGKYAELPKYNMLVASPYYAVEPAPVDEHGLTPHLTALSAYFDSRSVGILLVPTVEYLITQPSAQDLKKYCRKKDDNWDGLWPGIWKKVLLEPTLRHISFSLGVEISFDTFRSKQKFHWAEGRFHKVLERYFERHKRVQWLPRLAVSTSPRYASESQGSDIPPWIRSEFARTGEGKHGTQDAILTDMPEVVPVVSYARNKSYHAAVLIRYGESVALVLPVCDLNICKQDIRDFLKVRKTLLEILAERPEYEPELQIHRESLSVRCVEKNIGYERSFKITGPQQFQFLCLLAENVGTIVPTEFLEAELTKRLSRYEGDIEFATLRETKRGVKRKFISKGAPKALVDSMFPRGGQQGYMLKAKVTFTNKPLA